MSIENKVSARLNRRHSTTIPWDPVRCRKRRQICWIVLAVNYILVMRWGMLGGLQRFGPWTIMSTWQRRHDTQTHCFIPIHRFSILKTLYVNISQENTSYKQQICTSIPYLYLCLFYFSLCAVLVSRFSLVYLNGSQCSFTDFLWRICLASPKIIFKVSVANSTRHIWLYFNVQTNPYGMKESGGPEMAAWSGSGLTAATGGYYSYDHSTLAAYG
jgi:hypothetical protein